MSLGRVRNGRPPNRRELDAVLLVALERLLHAAATNILLNCELIDGDAPRPPFEDRLVVEELIMTAVSQRQPLPAWFSNKDHKVTRKTAVKAYGGECVCCGESDDILLDFDHAAGNGKADRLSGVSAAEDAMANLGNGKYRLLCVVCHRYVTRRGACTRAGHKGVTRTA